MRLQLLLEDLPACSEVRKQGRREAVHRGCAFLGTKDLFFPLVFSDPWHKEGMQVVACVQLLADQSEPMGFGCRHQHPR